MSTITTTIRANNQFSGTLQQLASEAASIRRAILDGNRQSVQSFETVGKTLAGVAANTKKSWQEMAVSLNSALNLAQGAFSKFQNFYGQFIRWEDAATRLAPLVGGLDAAKELASHLRDEAANGTMSFEQLASVAGRLSSAFKNSDDIKKWVSIFHNLSAGTGLDVNELIGNFTKLKAAGRVTGEFPEMFAQKGVNIFGALEKQTGKTAAELRKMAAAGTLAFSEIEKALEAVAAGTGKFAGQAAAMSNTFGGSIGTMLANWDILKAELVKPIAESLTPTIQWLAGKIREGAAAADELGEKLIFVGKVAAPIAGVLGAVKLLSVAVRTAKTVYGTLFALTQTGFTKLKADTAAATVATARLGDAAGVAGAKMGTWGKVTASLGRIAGLAGIIGSVAGIGFDIYLAYLDSCNDSAEKLINTQQRLNAALGNLENARSEIDFEKARENVEAIASI